MGKVYKGRCVDERTGMYKEVAIKFMFSDLPEHAIERARREASIRLRNDNLVEMLGFIETTEKNDKIFHSKAGKKAHAGVWRTKACRPGPDMM